MIADSTIWPKSLNRMILCLVNQGKEFLLIFFLFASIGVTARQSNIYGAVIDKSTGESLPFVNVFIASTTIGSVTTKSGKFMIKDVPPGTVEIVASFVGYATQSQHIKVTPNQVAQVFFSLMPDERQLNEVQLVSKRDKKWERQLARFESVFIGGKYDPFVANTKILNPWVLNFDEGKESGGSRYFAATSSQPVEIENKDLGYKVIYHLDQFYQTWNGFYYVGPIQYIELDTVPDEKVKNNRQMAYLGSTRHFLKAMLKNQVEEQGFRVYTVHEVGHKHVRTNRLEDELGNTLDTITSIPDMISLGNDVGKYNLRSEKRLEIHYLNQSWPNEYYADAFFPVSWLIFKDSTIEVSANGVVTDPEELIISGYMANGRVARMLPHNFKPGKDTVLYDQEQLQAARQRYKRENLREKPYLSTDKPYYYPGETVWLKALMLYHNPLMMDTLSRVLYLDLINEEKQIITSSTYPIQNGMAAGQLEINRSLSVGNYNLRAYTNWMLNYPLKDLVYHPVPILDINYAVEPWMPPTQPENTEVTVDLIPDRDTYGHREKITVDLLLKSEDGLPLAGNFTVSVTDTTQVTDIAEVPTIHKAYEWLDSTAGESAVAMQQHQIEYGISVSGEFRDKKGLPIKAQVMIVQGEYEDYGMVDTDDQGRFWTSGLHFTDSAELALGVMNSKGRPYGSVVLKEKPVVPVAAELPSIALKLADKHSPQRHFSMGENYTLLEEVVVQEKAIKEKENTWRYGKPDREITKQDLVNSSYSSALDVIRTKVGGVRVEGDPSGYTLKMMRNQNFGMQTAEPLLIIDGMRFTPSEGLSVADMLFSLPPNEIESIAVYTYNAGVFGLQAFGGAIEIKTNRYQYEDPAAKAFNKEGFSLYTVKGYTPVKEFHSPDYSSPQESHANPDYRSTLYWNPSVSTDAETGKASFSFYSADLATTYRIVVEGVTDDNTPFREVKYVKVGR